MTDNLPVGTNLLIKVAPETGITGQNIINDGVSESHVLTDGADFGTPDAFTATQVSFTTNVNAYKTLVLPFEATVPADFTAAKAASVTGNLVNLEETSTIGAGQPVLVQGTGEFQLTASNAAVAATEDAALTEGVLSGTYKSIPAPVGSYVLQNQNSIIGFYQVAETQPTVGAFRAWLNVPASDVKAYYFGDEATSINEVFGMTLEGAIYNLAGQRLSKMQKGVNIVNGKKILK